MHPFDFFFYTVISFSFFSTFVAEIQLRLITSAMLAGMFPRVDFSYQVYIFIKLLRVNLNSWFSAECNEKLL